MAQSIRKNYLSADAIGMASSSLCLIHCIITPFIFIAQACSMSCCASSPLWWKAIDFIFLIISFVAIHFASKISSHTWVKIALYSAFSALTFLTINHHSTFIKLPLQLNYASAFLLFFLHLYNKRYCKCCEDSCEFDRKKSYAAKLTR